MASDQRYCVNCGARRGRPRFPAEPVASAGDRVPAPAPAAPPSPQSRWGGATALIAGVGTLLLAMGVGVLIGHNTSDTPTRAAAPQVITVGGGTANAATTATSPTATTAKQTPQGSSTKPKTAVVHVTPKVSKAAAGAASKTLGGSAPKNPTVSSGDSCQQGDSGCGKDGKFDGSFFGP
jgi:hypothetical protein